VAIYLLPKVKTLARTPASGGRSNVAGNLRWRFHSTQRLRGGHAVTIQVLITDDHKVVRRRLRGFLEYRTRNNGYHRSSESQPNRSTRFSRSPAPSAGRPLHRSPLPHSPRVAPEPELFQRGRRGSITPDEGLNLRNNTPNRSITRGMLPIILFLQERSIQYRR
jgi:hypothetical protein